MGTRFVESRTPPATLCRDRHRSMPRYRSYRPSPASRHRRRGNDGVAHCMLRGGSTGFGTTGLLIARCIGARARRLRREFATARPRPSMMRPVRCDDDVRTVPQAPSISALAANSKCLSCVTSSPGRARGLISLLPHRGIPAHPP